MKIPPFLRTVGAEVYLAVKVQPRASRNELTGLMGNELKLKVTAPPVDSAANEAVVAFLAEKLDCPRRNVFLVHGQTSRHKTIGVRGISIDAISVKLGF